MNSSKWMSQLNASLKLHQISIPGSHDSGSYTMVFGKCQNRNIIEQLDDGIRFLDLRFADSLFPLNIKPEDKWKTNVRIAHGPIISDINGYDLFQGISNWTKSHLSEIVIISCRCEGNHSFEATKKLFQNVLNPAYFHIIPSTGGYSLSTYTLNELRQHGNVILLVDATPVIPNMWYNWTDIISPWIDKTLSKSDEIATFLNTEPVDYYPTNPMHITQCLPFVGVGMDILADNINRTLQFYIKNGLLYPVRGQKRFNIILMNFYKNTIFNEFVINLNNRAEIPKFNIHRFK